MPSEVQHLRPALAPGIGQDLQHADAVAEMDSRSLFYRLVHASEYPAVMPVAYSFLQHRLQRVWISNAAECFKQYQPNSLQAVFSVAAPEEFHKSLFVKDYSEYLIQVAPVCLTECSWLHGVLQACCNQSPQVHALYSIMLQLSQGEQSGDVLRAQLTHAGVELPGVHTWAFANQERVFLSMYDFGVLQLALARFPRALFPELLGFSVGYCQAVGVLEWVGGLTAEHSVMKMFLRSRVSRLQAQIGPITEIIQSYLGVYSDQVDYLWQRIQSGYQLYLQHSRGCCQDLQTLLHNPTSQQQQVISLLERIRQSAVGHHARIRLGEHTLDEWFSSTTFNGELFLQALLQSPYVDRQQPANSPLLRLFEFKGPMFGVLSTEELTIISHWLIAATVIEKDLPLVTVDRSHEGEGAAESGNSPEGANEPAQGADAMASRRPKPGVNASQQASVSATGTRFCKLTRRTLYYALVNGDLYPELLAAAKHKVISVLRATSLLNRMPFKVYSHQRFDHYINALYQREVKAYQPLALPPRLARQTYCWGIEQLAPTILTDGCWLQQANVLLLHPQRHVAKRLLQIYADEMGGGVLQRNHPYLYQQLMHSIGLQLPPIEDLAFSQHPGFINSAFNIPNYLLAIAQFPVAYLPELLGLTMAIELSGLGRVYLRLAQALDYYGLDPTIVKVHISIDNVATGHAALAKQAIQMYLDDILAGFGAQAQQAHWRRIYMGYCSLATVTQPFSIALVGHHVARKLTRRF